MNAPASMPTVTAPAKIEGRLLHLLTATARDRLGFRSSSIEYLDLDLEGIAGDRHRGWTRASDARVPYLPRGTTIRNSRHLSIVSVEDCAELARRLDLVHLDPGWLGANIVTQGIPHLSFLPRGTRLICDGGAVLVVEDQNPPCSITGEAVQLANPGRTDLKVQFPKIAKRLRGLVATVEHPGRLTTGGAFVARLPEQWIYAASP